MGMPRAWEEHSDRLILQAGVQDMRIQDMRIPRAGFLDNLFRDMKNQHMGFPGTMTLLVDLLGTMNLGILVDLRKMPNLLVDLRDIQNPLADLQDMPNPLVDLRDMQNLLVDFQGKWRSDLFVLKFSELPEK